MEKTIKKIEAHLALWIEMVAVLWIDGNAHYLLFNEYQISMFRSGRTLHFGLVVNGETVAKSQMSWMPGCSAIWFAHGLWVHEDYRSKGKHSGCGALYIIRQWQRRLLLDMEASRVYITVPADNPAGLRAAEKAGYVRMPDPHDVVSERHGFGRAIMFVWDPIGA